MENNEKNNELLNIDQPEAVRWYEKQISLDDARTFIKANITTAARSFIAIGFYLKCVRDQELFLEDGYQSVWEFAQAEYGISKSTASRYMTMNDRFSQDGNSPNVKEEYKAFGKSQLQEMLALTDEQLEQVKPTDRVEDIRGMRKPKEIPYIELPGQMEIEKDFLQEDFNDIFPEEEFETVPSQPLQKQVFSVDISELVGDMPEDVTETQQIDESVAISQQEPEEQTPKPEPEPQAWKTNPTPCIYREGYSCTVPETQKYIPGDGSNCGQSCCWECTKRGECKWECNSSQLRPEEPEPIKPELLHVYEDQAPDESWKFGDLPQAKEKYVKSLTRVLVEKKGKYLRYSVLYSELNDEAIGWRLKGLAKETDQAIEIDDGVIACPCEEVIEFSRGDEDLGLCSYIRFGTQVRKALEDWKARQDSEAETAKLVEPDPVTDAEYEEVPASEKELKPIGELDLSCRTENILKRAGIDTVEGLASMSDEELTAVRGMSNRDMEEIKAKLNGIESADKEEPEESATDLQVVRQMLEKENKLLSTCLMTVPDQNDIHIRRMKLKVAALASFVCDLDDIENPAPKPEQPELPLLKNNDQRAAFVDAYETWPLWIETAETGERYYRYDLADGTSMVVKVYYARIFDGYVAGSYESRYREGYERHEYYLLQPGKFFKDCETNRSSLIDKLKEIQKKEKA